MWSPRFPNYMMMAFEKEPGPNNYYIKRALHGTYHQRNENFGKTVGIQCTSNVFCAIYFSVFKKCINLGIFWFRLHNW